jgi:hypothetical protein
MLSHRYAGTVCAGSLGRTYGKNFTITADPGGLSDLLYGDDEID